MQRLLLILGLGLLAACTGRGPNGIVIDTDGSILDMNAENMRVVHGHRLARDIEHELGEGWTVAARIDGQPIWDEHHDPRWYYQRVGVELQVAPPPEQEPEAVDRAQLRKLLHEHFLGKVAEEDPGRLRGRIAVVRELSPWPEPSPAPAEDAAAEATAPEPEQAEAALGTPRPSGGWSYTLQKGDTLAAISTAFYGSPQHWRRIAEANPELDPAALVAGERIQVPPPPGEAGEEQGAEAPQEAGAAAADD